MLRVVVREETGRRIILDSIYVSEVGKRSSCSYCALNAVQLKATPLDWEAFIANVCYDLQRLDLQLHRK
jgi:hypothetical protein